VADAGAGAAGEDAVPAGGLANSRAEEARAPEAMRMHSGASRRNGVLMGSYSL